MNTNLMPDSFNEAWIRSALTKLTREVAYRTYNMHLPLTAEDIASKAITYALKPMMDGTGMFPTSEKRLLSTARKVAKWAIIDAIKESKKMMESTDEEKENDDGTASEDSPYMLKHVWLQYREDKNHEEFLDIGRAALGKLDAFLAKKGVSKRDIEIYMARDLYKEPTDAVCAKHSVTPGNLYKIVSVVKDVLRKHGPSLLRE